MNFFVHDYKTKDELLVAIKGGLKPRVWTYRGTDLLSSGWTKVHAPNPPANHTWEVEVLLDQGRVVKVR